MAQLIASWRGSSQSARGVGGGCLQSTPMNTKPTAPSALTSPAARAATAIAAVSLVALAWAGAVSASHEAVNHTTAQLSREVNRIHLPTVVVVGQREVQVATARPSTL